MEKPEKLRAVSFPVQNKVLVIPSLITVLGIFSGFLAIALSMQNEFSRAAMWIGVAFILDGLDGRVARRLNATSEFGREFDSLSDVVVFGVAPAIMVFRWGFLQTMDEFGFICAYLYVVCAATRLARFNITTTEEPKSYFEGLPTPGAAAVLAGLLYFHPTPLEGVVAASAVWVLVMSLAFLMVSSIRFTSLKKVKLKPGNPRLFITAAAAAVALVWYNSRVAFFGGTLVYALSGPILFIYKRFQFAADEKAEAIREKQQEQ